MARRRLRLNASASAPRTSARIHPTPELARRDYLRASLALLGGALVCAPASAWAFGEEGAFHPRVLLTGAARWQGLRTTAPARWSDEVVRRTSAPGRLRPATVHADEAELLAEAFVVWGGAGDVAPLTSREIARLRQFFAMGGMLLVDDFDPSEGGFGRGARREIARVLPDQAPVAIGPENVVFRSFYLMKRAVGRVLGPPKLEAVLRAGQVQVLFSSHDLLGALARDPAGGPSLDVEPGGDRQREEATRLAVNIALYVLCSNYKDDQVHAEHIMRRRGGPR